MSRQKFEIECLRLGDGNNAYFYASLKAKHIQSGPRVLYKGNETILIDQEDIEQEVIEFMEIQWELQQASWKEYTQKLLEVITNYLVKRLTLWLN